MKILLLVLISLSIILISIKIILNYVAPLKEKIKIFFSKEFSENLPEDFPEEVFKNFFKRFLFWDDTWFHFLVSIIFGIILVVQGQDFYNSLLMKITLIFLFSFFVIFYGYSDLKLFLVYRSYKKKLKQNN